MTTQMLSVTLFHNGTDLLLKQLASWLHKKVEEIEANFCRIPLVSHISTKHTGPAWEGELQWKQ